MELGDFNATFTRQTVNKRTMKSNHIINYKQRKYRHVTMKVHGLLTNDNRIKYISYTISRAGHVAKWKKVGMHSEF